MSRQRGILLEIAGCEVAFTGNEASLAPVQFGQSLVEAITAINRSQTMAIDAFEGTFESGGITLSLNKESGILLSRLTSPRTFLAEDITETSDPIKVKNSSGFPTNGYIWIGGECIHYDANDNVSSPNEFYLLNRGTRGTIARPHPQTTEQGLKTYVYGFNPQILGRLGWVWWYDLESPSEKTLRFVGYIDAFDFAGEGFTLSLINGAKLLQDAEVMGGHYAGGELLGAYMQVGGYVRLFEDLGLENASNAFLVGLDNTNYPFPSTSNYPRYLQIDEEIIKYRDEQVPATEGMAGNVGVSGARLYFDTKETFQRGDFIRFHDSLGQLQKGVIVEEASSGGATYPNRYYHSAPANPDHSEWVETPNKQEFSAIQRAKAQTRLAEHKRGSRVKELRLLEGDHIDCVLRLLLSDKGNGSNGPYDNLPSGWGAAIPSALVDVDSFKKIADYSTDRLFSFDGPVKVSRLLSNLARITNSRIFWNEEGLLTCNVERDVYPDSVALQTITNLDLAQGTRPRWGIRQDRIFNLWIFRGNAPKGSDFKDEATFELEESVARYGRRSLPDYEDPGLVFTKDVANLQVVAGAVLRRWSEPVPYLEPTVQINESTVFQPGKLIGVVMPHLPNLRGGKGLEGELFEILHFVPNNPQGQADLVLAAMPAAEKTGLIAPAGVVEVVDGLDVTLKTGAQTHFANPGGKSLAILPPGEDGSEDVHYFLEGYAVKLWDASTLANTPPTTAQATVDAVDYGQRKLTLSAVPGWLSGGDLLRLDKWDVVKASVNPTPVNWFICLADGSHVPPDLGSAGNAAFVWGL